LAPQDLEVADCDLILISQIVISRFDIANCNIKRLEVTNCDFKFEVPNWNLKNGLNMVSKITKDIETAVVTLDQVERRIYSIRGHKVMLDSELAELYGVSTGRMNEQVRRNRERFPDDFMFQLNAIEFKNLISQIAISSSNNYGGRRKLPHVFTEQGVAMLSSVLKSDRAVQVNIAIMRAFVNMRRLVATNVEISSKLAAIEKKLGDHDEDFKEVFAAIRAMMAPERQPKEIGYIKNKKG